MEFTEDKSIRDRIVQKLIKRKYEKQGITLVEKFWNLPKYKNEYVRQTASVAKFIRAYGAEAVFNVVEREEWCWSLSPKQMPELMELEVGRLRRDKAKNEAKKSEPEEPQIENKQLFRKRINGQEANKTDQKK